MKQKIINRLIVILAILVIGVISNIITNSRILSGNIEIAFIYKLSREDINSIKNNGDGIYELLHDQLDEVLKFPEKFLILEYGFYFKNISKWRKVKNIRILPEFPEKIQRFIYAYSKHRNDGLVAPIDIEPNSFRADGKRILIKNTDITPAFIKLLSQIKFRFKGKVMSKITSEKFIPLGTCLAKGTYDKKFKVIKNKHPWEHEWELEENTESNR